MYASQCRVIAVYSYTRSIQSREQRERQTDTEGMAGRYRSHQEQYPQWLDYA